VRVGKGSISTWSCDSKSNGFQPISDYIIGPGGEQLTEMGANGSGAMVWSHTNVFAAGSLITTYDTDGLHFYLNDMLGNRRVQTDYAGVTEQTCTNLPFGDGLNCSGSLTSPTEHHFTGKERDAESGNDYFGARYYASSMGRFMSPDWAAKEEPVPYATMDDPQSLNLYSYVRNNPLVRVDADGHCAEDLCIGEGAGAVVVGAAILGTAAFVGVAKYFSTDSGQRSLSTFTSAAGDSIHTNVQKVENAVTGLFSKPAAPGSRPGQDFTKAGKKTIDQTNAANHGGDNKCDKCDKDVRKVASEKGEPTPDDQLQRHHIEPKAAGGSGTPENGQVLCPDCHQAEHAPQPKPTPQPNQ
jgi:RHS repeat-associated protein